MNRSITRSGLTLSATTRQPTAQVSGLYWFMSLVPLDFTVGREKSKIMITKNGVTVDAEANVADMVEEAVKVVDVEAVVKIDGQTLYAITVVAPDTSPNTLNVQEGAMNAMQAQMIMYSMG